MKIIHGYFSNKKYMFENICVTGLKNSYIYEKCWKNWAKFKLGRVVLLTIFNSRKNYGFNCVIQYSEKQDRNYPITFSYPILLRKINMKVVSKLARFLLSRPDSHINSPSPLKKVPSCIFGKALNTHTCVVTEKKRMIAN